MKTLALNLSLMILLTMFFSCEKENVRIEPSNQVTTEERTISSFDELDVSGPFKVHVTFSDTEESLRIEANQNIHAVIEVNQNSGKLSIEIEDNVTIRNGQLVLNVFVSTKQLNSIKGEGTAQISLQNAWDAERAEIQLEGAAFLQGELHLDQLSSTLEGASNLNIQGDADLFEITAEGASDMEGFDFATNDLIADLSGGCKVSVWVNNKLDVEAEGASTVFYKGNGVIERQNLSDSSKIIKVQ